MNYKSILILLLVGLTLSCSDDVVTPEEEFDYRDYMILDTGSYWVYQSYGIESNGNIFLNSFAFDSTFIMDSLYLSGRNAIKMGNRNIVQGKSATNEFYYSLDSNQISILGITLAVNDLFNIVTDDWITLYDQYRGNWFNIPLGFNDTTIGGSTYNGFIRFDGYNEGSTKIEYQGKKIKAFTTHLVIKYEIEQMSDTLRIIDKREQYSYRFAKDIGLVYTKYLEYQDSVLVGGYEKIIDDYKVK